MDEAISKELLKTANQSGFPFQIGVRNEIERTISEHGWNIVAEEYPWTHSIGGKSGFIDLLAEHKSYIFRPYPPPPGPFRDPLGRNREPPRGPLTPSAPTPPTRQTRAQASSGPKLPIA